MKELARKRELLEQSGYVYNFDREVYFNPVTKKVFSVEFIEDHSADELGNYIRERTQGTDWHFYFNSVPSESARRQLEGVLG
jgi:hypothetical protein